MVSESSCDVVLAFVAESTGVAPGQVTLSSRLAQDLGLDGDDAVEFMEAFKSHFGVDLSAFEFRRHFGPEAAFSPLHWLFWLVVPSRRPHLTPITVQNLCDAAETKRWKSL